MLTETKVDRIGAAASIVSAAARKDFCRFGMRTILKWRVSFIVLALPFGWASANAACNPANVQARLVMAFLKSKGQPFTMQRATCVAFFICQQTDQNPGIKVGDVYARYYYSHACEENNQ